LKSLNSNYLIIFTIWKTWTRHFFQTRRCLLPIFYIGTLYFECHSKYMQRSNSSNEKRKSIWKIKKRFCFLLRTHSKYIIFSPILSLSFHVQETKKTGGMISIVNFINILQAALLPMFFWQKIIKPNCD